MQRQLQQLLIPGLRYLRTVQTTCQLVLIRWSLGRSQRLRNCNVAGQLASKRLMHSLSELDPYAMN